MKPDAWDCGITASMPEKPYAAPKAPVADIAASLAARVRPPQIRWVIWLAIANYVLNFAVVALNWNYYMRTSGVAALIASQAVGLAIAVWFYSKIWQGRNWARIVLLVFSLFGMAVNFTAFFQSTLAAVGVGVKGVLIVCAVMNIIVLYLLFLSPG